MASSSALPIPSLRQSSFSNHHSATVLKWGLRRVQDAKLVAPSKKGQAFRVLANPNVSPGKASSRKEVIMVDPLEAKRLAAKQMEEIKAKEKLKRRRQIEAINGTWAMLGLTAGLVVEGQTGNSILAQVRPVESGLGWLGRSCGSVSPFTKKKSDRVTRLMEHRCIQCFVQAHSNPKAQTHHKGCVWISNL
ncbi:uncharacterized protein LOC130773835 isoform X2 [Actinidia eriantha]|uniref:uncharacterized protein LOC130773835 isoform X2 n=1 Tax=Actinidia eriantha TaxID=165200 RepID=UPI00258ACC88|nr:uncharacterized protein LOC130773835 isoform X2 [Actinidia eriantha]